MEKTVNEEDTISQKITQSILDSIKSGKIKPGDSLTSEREMAQNFNVSRQSVREAIKGLRSIGILKGKGRGVIVDFNASNLLGPLQFYLTLDDTSVDSLYEARAIIEGGICAIAAQKITDEQQESLEAIYREQVENIDNREKFRELDSIFHAQISEITLNAFLTRIASALNVLGWEFRKTATETREYIQGSIQDHRHILDALKQRNPNYASAAMQMHTHNVRKKFHDYEKNSTQVNTNEAL